MGSMSYLQCECGAVDYTSSVGNTLDGVGAIGLFYFVTVSLGKMPGEEALKGPPRRKRLPPKMHRS